MVFYFILFFNSYFLNNLGPIPFSMADNAKSEFRRFLDNYSDPSDVYNIFFF